MEEAIKDIKLLILDVDGVLTDGRVYLDKDGRCFKSFHMHDGMGIVIAKKAGIDVVFMTSKDEEIALIRGEELGVDEVYTNVKDKQEMLYFILKQYGLTKKQVAYMGDDLNDLSTIRDVGFSFAPNDACEDIKREVSMVTKKPAGKGAVREAIEFILRSQGKWEGIIEKFKGKGNI
jgi:3-deoxy-D-manno-octulosonate 8-phosphate phosphatase (KDO 8-P phosphatase)